MEKDQDEGYSVRNALTEFANAAFID